ncbi:hypothetical protein FMM55_03120 [Campylobacter sp. LR196d]|uniref:hypothetical protein n=1 Tax=Campylobacter sp. LR196d TaxID=2593543 RepID=UPI00123A0664|nr:hypothetical protein [Campylobacter sp. LR196d]KAA6227542.1 hypothetical protein FMM55_03120 [Campylobacter sp. LR196d]
MANLILNKVSNYTGLSGSIFDSGLSFSYEDLNEEQLNTSFIITLTANNLTLNSEYDNLIDESGSITFSHTISEYNEAFKALKITLGNENGSLEITYNSLLTNSEIKESIISIVKTPSELIENDYQKINFYLENIQNSATILQDLRQRVELAFGDLSSFDSDITSLFQSFKDLKTQNEILINEIVERSKNELNELKENIIIELNELKDNLSQEIESAKTTALTEIESAKTTALTEIESTKNP